MIRIRRGDEVNIPLYKIYWDEDDVDGLTTILRRGKYWTGGSENVELEKKISSYIGRHYGVTFNSGTSSLTALFIAYGLNPGDEVIVPAFTYPSTVEAVKFAGAKPIFADIEEETYGLDVDHVERQINERTKAVLAVHMYGLPCRIKELRELADRCGLLLIEDAAEAMGSRILGKKAGCFGDAAMFSFAGNKIITTGEGGMAVTDSLEVYEKLKQIRDKRSWRMSTIQAALGISQFNKLDAIINMRRRKAFYLSSHLQKIRGIEVPLIPRGHSHTFQFYTIRVKNKRDGLKKHLEERGITVKVYFPSLHSLPVSDLVSSEVLTLPVYPGLKLDEMNYIVNSIREFMLEE